MDATRRCPFPLPTGHDELDTAIGGYQQPERLGRSGRSHELIGDGHRDLSNRAVVRLYERLDRRSRQRKLSAQ